MNGIPMKKLIMTAAILAVTVGIASADWNDGKLILQKNLITYPVIVNCLNRSGVEEVIAITRGDDDGKWGARRTQVAFLGSTPTWANVSYAPYRDDWKFDFKIHQEVNFDNQTNAGLGSGILRIHENARKAACEDRNPAFLNQSNIDTVKTRVQLEKVQAPR